MKENCSKFFVCNEKKKVEPYSSVDLDAIVELDVPMELETLPEHVKMKITPVVTTQVLNGHT